MPKRIREEENYENGPVARAARRFRQSEEQRDTTTDSPRTSAAANLEVGQGAPAEVPAATPGPAPPVSVVPDQPAAGGVPEVDDPPEEMTSVIKFKVTPSEAERIHKLVYDVTGKRNNVSAFFRSLWLIADQAIDDLQARKPDIAALKRSMAGQNFDAAVFETKQAQIIFDALKSAGPPKLK